MSLQRLALFIPNLRELNLDGSCLGSLRDLGCGLTSLHVLRVSRCGLESLDGTFGLMSLRELHASNNIVDDVGPCSSLPHIRIIDLRKNTVEDVSFLEFLNVCSHLEALTLAECPAASKPGYRATIRSLLPNLVTLDGIPISQYGSDGEQNVENDDDDDDDDDNYDVEGEHPNQDSFRPTSRGDMFLHRPETPEYPRRRGGYGDGSGGNAAQRPSLNEDNATASQSSNTSDEVESPDCSSSGYQADTSQAYTNLHATQGSSSDSTLVLRNQELSRKGAAKRRPSTAMGIADTSPEKPPGPPRTSTPRKPRPSSAATATDERDLSGACTGDPRCDFPSALTSGLVVCGNLTVALRSRRRRQDAWTEEDLSAALQPRTKIDVERPGHLTVAEENGSGEGQEVRVEEPDNTDLSAISDVLEESKRWRELYATYRSENRLRWEKEDEDEMDATSTCKSEEEKLDQAETKPEATGTADTKKSAEAVSSLKARVRPCCSHFFARQKPALDTSYDADTSSNLDLSPQAEKTSRKKKASHGIQKY